MRKAGTLHRSSSYTGRWAIIGIAGALLAVAGLAAVRAQLSTSARAAAGATFTVTSDTDTDDGTCDAQCTLREAIHAANGNNNPNDTDTIAFNVPGAGVRTISPGTGGFGALPPIMEPVIIDGSTQLGANCETKNLQIEIEGSNISGGGTGLNVVGGSTTIRGVAINRFVVGIFLQTSGSNTVECSLIGTNAAGNAQQGNQAIGIRVRSADNTIGGAGIAARNIISGNGTGVYAEGLFGADRVHVRGNFIGLDVSGLQPLGNGLRGVDLSYGTGHEVRGNVIANNFVAGLAVSGGASGAVIAGNNIGTDVVGFAQPNGVGIVLANAYDTLVGGSTSADRNVISGNTSDGLQIYLGEGNFVHGNYIGARWTGTTQVPNGGNGVYIEMSKDNVIGGTAPGAGNLISGNVGSGILITGQAATGNRVLGNRIGTVASGGLAMPNAFGVRAFEAPNTVIGGATAAHRNVISGNLYDGVNLAGNGAVVAGNYIGTDASGTAPIKNGQSGVAVYAQGVTVGGASPAEGNLISGNTTGVVVSGSNTTGTTVSYNLIGTDAAGVSALPNGTGVIVAQSTYENQIGPGNTISGNTEAGIKFQYESHHNTVTGNLIGTALSGSVALANTHGVWIRLGSHDNTIGPGNTISGNLLGVRVTHDFGYSVSSGNVIAGNLIGTDEAGFSAVPNLVGVALSSSNNMVGGTSPAERNVISGNTGDGVNIGGATSSGNAILGNYIGANAAGTAAVPNSGQGVYIQNAPDNTIGGTIEGEANLISGNAVGGVTIVGATALNNAVVNNSFYANGGLAIDLGGDGPTANDPLDADAGPNDLLNAPTLTTAVSDGTKTAIAGQLSATPNSGFFVSVYTNAVCDPSGFGEGESRVWFMLVGTDANGLADLAFDMPFAVPPGQALTALTHAQLGPNTLGSTSEFSNCIPVTGAPLIPVEAGANGTVWTGDAGTLPGSFLTSRAVTPLPDEVSAVFHWNNDDQRFDFWFRGFPPAFNTLAGLEPGGYYFFQANGATTVNVPGFGAFTVSSPGGQFTTYNGATGWLWSGTNRPLAILATLPNGVSAIFAWNNGSQRFDFWFRGFPGPFQTLTAGIQRGGYYFFQSPGGTVVPLD